MPAISRILLRNSHLLNRQKKLLKANLSILMRSYRSLGQQGLATTENVLGILTTAALDNMSLRMFALELNMGKILFMFSLTPLTVVKIHPLRNATVRNPRIVIPPSFLRSFILTSVWPRWRWSSSPIIHRPCSHGPILHCLRRQSGRTSFTHTPNFIRLRYSNRTRCLWFLFRPQNVSVSYLRRHTEDTALLISNEHIVTFYLSDIHIASLGQQGKEKILGLLFHRGALISLFGQKELDLTCSTLSIPSRSVNLSLHCFQFADAEKQSLGGVSLPYDAPPGIKVTIATFYSVPSDVLALLGMDTIDRESLTKCKISNWLVKRNIVDVPK